MKISALSTEYLTVPFTADVTAASIDGVELALLPNDDPPIEADWVTATIVGETARVLVGPLEIPLTKGSWRVWVRITDTPEIPVEMAGIITVTD